MASMRKYLFEFEDFSWFPDGIRKSMVDYLSFFLRMVRFYSSIVPLIDECLQHTAHKQVVDFCSGGGGPMKQIQQELSAMHSHTVPVMLTDKFPNVDSYQHLNTANNEAFSFVEQSVDATQVPAQLKGVRTIFSAIHHFDEEQVIAVLKDAVDANSPIAIFDGGDKNLFTILSIIVGHPVLFFFCTPFIKPFRPSRIIFTYLVPVIPLCTVWDGVVSILRLHSPKDMLRMADRTGAKHYVWQAGTKKNKLGFNVAYLIGYPQQQA